MLARISQEAQSLNWQVLEQAFQNAPNKKFSKTSF